MNGQPTIEQIACCSMATGLAMWRRSHEQIVEKVAFVPYPLEPDWQP